MAIETVPRADGAAVVCDADPTAWALRLQVARSALAVWLLSLPGDSDAINHGNAPPLQVSLRYVGELLRDVREPDSLPGLGMIYARELVDMAERALWRFMCSNSAAPPRTDDLRATVKQAASLLAEAQGATA